MDGDDQADHLEADRDLNYGDTVVSIQGDRLTVSVAMTRLRRPAVAPRGEVGWFSAASRLRLLRITSSLNKVRMGRCSMLTLTWPDWIDDITPERRTLALSDLQRSLERLTKNHRPGIWRNEWTPRQSGDRYGQVWPHLHVLYYSCPWVDKEAVSEAWRRALQSHLTVRTKIEESRKIGQIQMYIAKYLAKSLPACVSLSLSHTSADGELLRPGRPWGIFRRAELPWADETEVVIPAGDARIDALRKEAKAVWDGVSDDRTQGYTVFGQRATLAARKIIGCG
jgi:hypothetical protein